MTNKLNIADIFEEITVSLRYMANSGFKGFDCSEKSLEIIKKWDSETAFMPESLNKISLDIDQCRGCNLYKTRKNIVSGEGDPKAKLVFVGKWPGFEEGQKNKPFGGASGRLLTRIIDSIKLNRKKVYICNIIKCSPPKNIIPGPDEIKACFPFLNRQLKIIKPNFICTLGTSAAHSLLKKNEPISELRGRFYDYNNIKIIPTYHPAYLLKYPEKKREVWEDMKMLIKEME